MLSACGDLITSLVHKPAADSAHRFHTVVHIRWKVKFLEQFDGRFGRG
jgi:hypothetical protein